MLGAYLSSKYTELTSFYDTDEAAYFREGHAKEIEKIIQSNKSLSDVLELGFHTVRNIIAFASLFNKIKFFGIDILPNFVRKVRNELESKNLRNVQLFCDNFMTTQCLLDKKFDLIYAGDGVMCHLTTRELAAMLDKLSHHLKKNSKIILSLDLPSNKTIELMQLTQINEFHLVNQGIFPHRLNDLLNQIKNMRLTFLRPYFTKEKRIGVFPENDTF